MSRILENLEPQNVMFYFEEICNIPHVSYHTGQLTAYLVSFAKEHGLRYLSDQSGNVIIFSEASKGYEDHPAVILQGHIDMVGAKAEGVCHDFIKDPIRLDPETLREGFISAQGTTLGGDDGIAVAYMLAVLSDAALKHPPIEAVFTVGEEVGLIGADALDCSVLTGKTLLNLDSEDEGVFVTGSAGGLRLDLKLPVHYEELEGLKVTLSVCGLAGGHSGTEIGTGRPSANVLLGRLFYEINELLPVHIISLYGGEVDNAIAPKAAAQVVIEETDLGDLRKICAHVQADLREEYQGIDDGITVTCDAAETGVFEACDYDTQEKIICFIRNVPYGVQARNAYNINFVETSLNPGIIRMSETGFTLGVSIRSSLESAKQDLANRLTAFVEFLGGEAESYGDYPGWAYDPDSKIRPMIGKLYEELTGKTPVFETIHAGLECGIFYERIPGVDIISFGPDMKDIHTFDEKLSIDSVGRVYELLVRLLERL